LVRVRIRMAIGAVRVCRPQLHAGRVEQVGGDGRTVAVAASDVGMRSVERIGCVAMILCGVGCVLEPAQTVASVAVDGATRERRFTAVPIRVAIFTSTERGTLAPGLCRIMATLAGDIGVTPLERKASLRVVETFQPHLLEVLRGVAALALGAEPTEMRIVVTVRALSVSQRPELQLHRGRGRHVVLGRPMTGQTLEIGMPTA